jgi:beta-glucosidase
LLRYIDSRYTRHQGLSINITENGFAVENEGELPLEHIIEDKDRQAYYAGYIEQMLRAISEDGIKMGSYFGWTLAE